MAGSGFGRAVPRQSKTMKENAHGYYGRAKGMKATNPMDSMMKNYPSTGHATKPAPNMTAADLRAAAAKKPYRSKKMVAGWRSMGLGSTAGMDSM